MLDGERRRVYLTVPDWAGGMLEAVFYGGKPCGTKAD
jgi:hypothetical protein